MTNKSMIDLVGNTPTVSLSLPDCKQVEAYIKLEGFNPTGSLKDRPAKWILLDKISTGELTREKIILDASSGSYACSLALFSAALGYKLTVTTGNKLTSDKAKFIDYFGAERISMGSFTIEGNDHCRKLAEENPDKYCFFDQLHNPQNVKSHYESTGPEILSAIPDLSAVAISVGSGGTSVGVAKYLKEKKPGIKIIAVTSKTGTKIPGTGAFIDGDYVTPPIKEARDSRLFDFNVEVSIDEAMESSLLLKRQGFYVGIQSGAVLAGMKSAIEQFQLTGKMLMISGDAGWKGTESIIF